MKGRALLDIPQHNLACGEFGEIPDKEAKHFVAIGSFDPKAPFPKEQKNELKPTADETDAPGPDETAAVAAPETTAAPTVKARR